MYISLLKNDDRDPPGFPTFAPARPFSAPGDAFRLLFLPPVATTTFLHTPTTHKAPENPKNQALRFHLPGPPFGIPKTMKNRVCFWHRFWPYFFLLFSNTMLQYCDFLIPPVAQWAKKWHIISYMFAKKLEKVKQEFTFLRFWNCLGPPRPHEAFRVAFLSIFETFRDIQC